jgi:hypothetical protein
MDTRLSIENLRLIVIPAPADTPAEANRTELKIWGKRVDKFVRRETQLEENMKTAYTLVWGQCSDMMRQRIETYNVYSEISTTGDVIALLKIIKGINFNFQSQKHVPVSLHEAKKSLYGC